MSLQSEKRIDELCDEFSALLVQGRARRIEDFLQNRPEPMQAELLRELAKRELEHRFGPKLDVYIRSKSEGTEPKPRDATLPYEKPKQTQPTNLPAIEGYTLEGVLGRGGMGIVYKARQEKPDRPVALKMLLDGESVPQEVVERFRTEPEDIARLAHPGIVQIFEVSEHSEKPYFSLEFCEGGSLAKYLAAGPPATTKTISLVIALAEAVQFAHDAGVIHRDLKPANVLLTTDGTPKLTDFGLAKNLGKETHTVTGAIMGTPSYMAPEQARGESKYVGASVDIYGLGAILYECLTGVPPFQGPTRDDIIRQVIDDDPIPPTLRQPAIPRDLETICLTCLDKDPSHRYETAAKLADDLRLVESGERPSIQPRSVWDWLLTALRTTPAPSSVYTWWAPLWLAGIVAVQHGTIYFLTRTDQPAWILWIVLLVGWLSMTSVLWFILFVRFRWVPVTERHSTLIATGNLIAQIVLYLTIGPLKPELPSKEILPIYPPLTIVTGLSLFVLGSTHWGKFLLIGLATMMFALVMTAWPKGAPLLFAVVIPAWLIWWGVAKRIYFVRGEAE